MRRQKKITNGREINSNFRRPTNKIIHLTGEDGKIGMKISGFTFARVRYLFIRVFHRDRIERFRGLNEKGAEKLVGKIPDSIVFLSPVFFSLWPSVNPPWKYLETILSRGKPSRFLSVHLLPRQRQPLTSSPFFHRFLDGEYGEDGFWKMDIVSRVFENYSKGMNIIAIILIYSFQFDRVFPSFEIG